MRVGFGFDAHRTGGEGPLKLAGVEVATDRGLIGTSDADVAVHALIDALLGAAALGDIGTYFPSSDPRWRGADSLDLLTDVVTTVASAGYRIGSVDLTIVAQNVRVAPHRETMRARLAETLGTPIDSVSVKATTTDALGFLGRDEGIGATAVAVIQPV
jgi:2-C-methyl-D-erythritol 2,4-cyclodiphosphate synthase